MPHITIESWPGRPPEVRIELARALRACMSQSLGMDPERISVSYYDIPKEEWEQKVVDRELQNSENLILPSLQMQNRKSKP